MQPANLIAGDRTNIIPFLRQARFPDLMVTARLFALCGGGRTRADQLLAVLIDDLESVGALTAAHTTALFLVASGHFDPPEDSPMARLWTGALSTLTHALQECQ